jgi:hypothetical protein
MRLIAFFLHAAKEAMSAARAMFPPRQQVTSRQGRN